MKEPIPLIDRIIENRKLLHVLFWLSTVLLFGLIAGGAGAPIIAGIIIKSFFLPAQIGATYFLIYYQIPKYAYTKQYFRFGLSLLGNALVFSTLGHLIEDCGLDKIATGYSDDDLNTFWEIVKDPFGNIGESAEDIYPTVFIVAALKFFKQRFEENTQLTILEQEKATAEIKLIKAQVNPRILSKALTQLYVLTKEESEDAPEVVIKLSDILDYLLYQCNAPKVLLSKEIELIENYLAKVLSSLG